MSALARIEPTPACAWRWRTNPYREALELRDGRSVLLRPAHRSDAAALQQFFAGLSPQARLLRFHGAVNRLPEHALATLSTQVPQRHVALLALAEADDTRTVVAEARYAVQAANDTDREAEYALAVADDWQGLGLGRALLQRLAVHARFSGIHTLHGSVMPGNEAMLALATGLGAELHSTHAEVVARLRL